MTPTNTPNGIWVMTLAGSGSPAFANGTGTAASFNMPHGVAVDTAGNVYVADLLNNRIRQISPGGVVSTLAGSGIIGSYNATGTNASFYYPQGVAVDTAGNVYVADADNNLIREITSGGVVSTLAGGGVPWATNGPGTTASFNVPEGVAVDTAGNVYVADYGNNLIREITSGGVVSTLAGGGSGTATNGTGTTASFSGPSGVAVDTAGNVYVADMGNNMIRKITQ
jgi:sugar lactone lactonase YvrE